MATTGTPHTRQPSAVDHPIDGTLRILPLNLHCTHTGGEQAECQAQALQPSLGALVAFPGLRLHKQTSGAGTALRREREGGRAEHGHMLGITFLYDNEGYIRSGHDTDPCCCPMSNTLPKTEHPRARRLVRGGGGGREGYPQRWSARRIQCSGCSVLGSHPGQERAQALISMVQVHPHGHGEQRHERGHRVAAVCTRVPTHPLVHRVP